MSNPPSTGYPAVEAANDTMGNPPTTGYPVVELVNSGAIRGFTGTMDIWLGATAPAGAVLADGSAYSRTGATANLFAVCGTTYGAGDGSTTFNVPDMRGRVPVGMGQGTGLTNRVLGATGGEEAHALTVGELAIHQHSHSHTSNTGNENAFHQHGVTDPGHRHTINLNFGSGTLSTVHWDGNTQFNDPDPAPIGFSGTGISIGSQNALHTHTIATDNTNTGSGTAHNNMEPFLVVNYIIWL